MIFTDKFDLSPYGEKLKKSYFVFRLMNKNETIKYVKDLSKLEKTIRKAIKEDDSTDEVIEQSEIILEHMYEVVERFYVSGFIYDEEKEEERESVKEDIESLTPKIVKDVISFLQGNLEKKR